MVLAGPNAFHGKLHLTWNASGGLAELRELVILPHSDPHEVTDLPVAADSLPARQARRG